MSDGHQVTAERAGDDARQRALRDELRTLVRSYGPTIPPDIGDQTSLVASGLIDSLGLFNLVLWIEEKSGRTIDPVSFDVARDCDSISAILRYVDRSLPKACATYPEVVSTARRPSRYRVASYESPFKRAVAEFQTGLWSPDADRNVSYLEWKFENNPCLEPPYICLAFADDEIVAMRGFYPSMWEVGQPTRRVPLLVADDLLVSEKHRNTGVVNEIMRSAREQLHERGERYVLNLSGGAITVVESLASGWRSAGMVGPVWTKRVSRFAHLHPQRLLAKLKGPSSSERDARSVNEPTPFARLDAARNVHADPGFTVDIDDRPRIGEMLDLIARIGHDGRWRHVRDEPYLRWRYRNPLREYRFLYATGTSLNGYLVIKRSIDREPSPRQVSIVDAEAVNEDVKYSLIEAALSAGAFEEVAVWGSTVGRDAQNRLRRLGFRANDARLTLSGTPYILVWSIDQDERGSQWRVHSADFLDSSNWDVRTIYSMVG